MSEEQVAEVSENSPEIAPSDDWRSQIPEDYRDHKSLSTINDVGALAKSFINAQQMIGAEKLPIPGKFATDEDWQQVDARLGRPESPDGYELQNNLSEGVEESPEMLDWFRQTAHDVGLRPQQAQKLLDAYNEHTGNMLNFDQQTLQEKQDQVRLELQRELGPAFDDKIDTAIAVMKNFGPENHLDIVDMQMADGSYLGDNPGFVKMMMGIGDFISSKIGEDTLEGVKTSNAMTVEEMRKQQDEIRGDYMKSPFWIQNHPGHEAAVSRIHDLQQQIVDAENVAA